MEDTDKQPERKLLKRELRAQALKRLEDSARTLRDYENLVAWYDRLDANRERRERYHELSRSGDDVPLDYGASANELYFPDYLNHVLEKQIRKGDFLDAIFNCPYDIHELVTDDGLCIILRELNEDHKELLYLCAIGCSVPQRLPPSGGRATVISARCEIQCSKRYEKSCLPYSRKKCRSSSP